MVKRLQVLQPPVRSRSYLAQISAEFDEAGVPLCFVPLPRARISSIFGQNKKARLRLSFGGHRRKPRKQIRHTDQDQLWVWGQGRSRRNPPFSGNTQ